MDRQRGSRFGWGLIVGAFVGFAAGAGAVLAAQQESLQEMRTKGIELGGRYGQQLREKGAATIEQTRRQVLDKTQELRSGQSPIGKAIADGIEAARQKRADLTGRSDGSGEPPSQEGHDG